MLKRFVDIKENKEIIDAYNKVKETNQEAFTIYDDDGNIIDKKVEYKEEKMIAKIEGINELNGIRIGDIVVFENNGQNLTGEIYNIREDNSKYLVRGNFTGKIKQDMYIKFDQITEHYPKNAKFNKQTEIERSNLETYPRGWKEVDGIMMDKDINKKIKESKNSVVVTFPPEMKQKEIDKLLPNFEFAKYFIVEKNNELHIVRIKEGVDIKPFVESLLEHLIKKKMIKEDISNMKLVGNKSFSIIKNPPKKLNELMKNLLKDLLK
jgi:hypothetical protein